MFAVNIESKRKKKRKTRKRERNRRRRRKRKNKAGRKTEDLLPSVRRPLVELRGTAAG